ncbi:MAG: cyclic nucleotide-binding domain-containing protein [Pseudomonadota bacterium]
MPGPVSFDLDFLASCHDLPTRRFLAGEKIFLQGDVPAAMYVVLSGLVHILSFGRILEDVGPGGVVGEMAIIEDAPRSAAAMAGVDTDVVVIDRPAFLRILRREPSFALMVMGQLAARIRRMNARAVRE